MHNPYLVHFDIESSKNSMACIRRNEKTDKIVITRRDGRKAESIQDWIDMLEFVRDYERYTPPEEVD